MLHLVFERAKIKTKMLYDLILTILSGTELDGRRPPIGVPRMVRGPPKT